jgi:glycosyltransferase involved in cell wall biosynthesis
MCLSIVIPTYDQHGEGPKMVIQLLNTIRIQNVNYPYEISISDTSTTEEIEDICKAFKMLPIVYTRNYKTFGASENINNAISLARYDMVKLMCQDDLFARMDSIDLFVKALQKRKWAISNSVHIDETGHVTYKKQTAYNHNRFDKNITGMPSVVGWHKCGLRFDESLKTVCDMKFYYDLYEMYGAPETIREFTIGQRFWKGSLSRNQINQHQKEVQYLREKRLIKC